MKRTKTTLTTTFILTLTSPTLADDTYEVIDGDVMTYMETGLATQGSLIGDYDEDTNPGGTRTIPGLFGNKGNHRIPTAASTNTKGNNTTIPSGSFDMSIGPFGWFGTLDNLSLDLLSGRNQKYITEITLRYDTFHTKNPPALYLGGFPITLPIAYTQVTAAHLIQLLPAITILDDGEPGEKTYETIIFCIVELDTALFDQPMPTIPLFAWANVSGSIYDLGGGEKEVTMTIDFPGIYLNITLPFPIPIAYDIPLDLPNIGEKPTVLLSLNLTDFWLNYETDVTLSAQNE